jgi:hypothetical protein
VLDDLEETYLLLVTPAYVGMSPATDSAMSWHSARNIHLAISKPSYYRSTNINFDRKIELTGANIARSDNRYM